MLNLSTALSALRANQVGLTVAGNNVANANTPDYHRQDVRLTSRPPVLIDGLFIGQGVTVSEIDRAYHAATEQAITRNIADAAGIETRLQTARQLEGYLSPGEGSVNDRIERLFNDLQRLTTVPDDAAARTVVVRAAQSLTTELNRLDKEFDQLLIDLKQTIDDTLRRIENASAEIIDINRRIRQAEMQGQSPNDLRDRRDKLINELAALIDVKVETQTNVGADITSSEDIFRMANGQLSFQNEPVQLHASLQPDGTVKITKAGSLEPILVVQGKLGGLLTSRDEIVRGYQQRLEAFVQGLVEAVDTTHATGLGLDGSFDTLLGHRQVDDVTIPLASADTIVPIRSGSLFVTVNAPSGQSSLHEITIDSTVDTLEDVAAKLSAVANIQATVDANSGRIAILATPGFTFDFAGRIPSDVDTSLLTGATQPSVAGIYDGEENQVYTFEFNGTGIVGTTPGLQLEMRDSTGAVVSTFDVGRGYEPASALPIGHGVEISLTADSANLGDRFSVQVVAEPDTTGFLAAMGLNTLFVGDRPGNLAINQQILDDSSRLATTKTGEPFDSRNAAKLLKLRYEPLLANRTDTLEEHFSDIVASVGVDIQDLSHVQENLDVIGRSLIAEQQSVSGVDPNEEAIRMLQFQRGFQAAARYVVTIDETLEELFSILR